MPDEVKLIGAIDAYAEQAHGSETYGDELSTQRALSLEAYAGQNLEPAPEGRSQVVSRDLFSTIQWILPSLTKIFAGGDDVVEFDPSGPEDEDAAKQESKYLNYLVTQKNNWFLTCLTWFQDALLTKNAYCMASMEEKIVPETETYEGQSIEQVAMLLEDDVEIVEQEELIDEEDPIPMTDEQGQPMVDPMTGQPMMQPRVTYNITLKKTKATRKLNFKILPPERVRVGEDTPDFTLENCNYFEYWDLTTISDLRKMGFDVDDDIGGDDYYETEEDAARDEYLENDSIYDELNGPDPSMRKVKVRWIWIRHDYDEDGIAELQYVVRVGNEILEREVVSTIPVACIVPFPNTHRHMGLSVADLVFDIQRIKTAILRAGIDSLNLSTNPRHAISNEVNLEDMLVSRPGGLVRMKSGSPAVPGQGHIQPLMTEFVFPQAQEGMRFMDSVAEDRVGVNKLFQGIDESSVNDHNRIGQLSTMAAQRVEQIARIFGNGVERLFRIAHELVLKSGHKEETVRLNGNWINIDPSQWRTGRDMRVVAPYAAGNKDALVQRLMLHMSIHEKALASGLPIVDPSDAYELAKMLASATDIPGDRIYTDPTTVQPPEPGPDHTMIALEIEQQKAENEAQDEARQAELDKYKADLDAQIKQLQISSNQELQIALAQLKAGQQIDLEKVRAMLKEGVIEQDGQAISVAEALASVSEAKEALRQQLQSVVAELTQTQQAAQAPREIVRDESGKVIGVSVDGEFRELKRDEEGRVIGL